MNLPATHPGSTALIVLLLGGLTAWTFSPGNAVGYPAGSAISTGSNPVTANGGRLPYSGGSETVFTAPADQNIVVTDVVLTGVITSYDCRAQSSVILSTPSGPHLARFSVDMRTYSQSSTGVVTAHYQSGLPVAAGESLTIETSSNFTSCSSSDLAVDYSISGYLAQP